MGYYFHVTEKTYESLNSKLKFHLRRLLCTQNPGDQYSSMINQQRVSPSEQLLGKVGKWIESATGGEVNTGKRIPGG
jgi:hypothetical protein